MVEKITLRFQKLRIVTLLAWVVILVLGFMTDDVISPVAFWILALVVVALISIDVVYFVIRMSEAHYLQVTPQKVIIKRVFRRPKALLISEIKRIMLIEKNATATRIVLSDGTHAIDIQRIYKLSKDVILRTIKGTEDYPKGLEIERIKGIW